MIMTDGLVQAIDDRLNKLVPGEKTYYNDEAWDCFIDELTDSQVRLSLVEEQLLFWKYTESTDLDILDRLGA
jgi:hypothetical protein